MTIIETARWQRATHSQDLPAAIMIAGLAVLAVALHILTPFNHDEAWFLAGAARLLDGGHFGSDIVDVNPLPVWWLSIVPVWLGRQIGARSDIVATVLTVLTAVLSLVAADRLIEPANSAGRTRRALLAGLAIILLFVPGYDFGQREHLAALLALPYVMARGRRMDSAKTSALSGAVIGVVACLGFCLKPYLLLVPVALEIWLLVRTRKLFIWLGPETIALAITGLILAALTLFYRPTYFERTVPEALLGYWVLHGTLAGVMHTATVVLAPTAALALLGYLTRRRDERIPALAQAFAVAGAASLVVALVQMTPWSYHFLPSVIFFDLAAVILLVAGTPRADLHTIRRAAFAILIVVGFSNSATEAAQTFAGDDTGGRVARLAAIFRANPGPNKTVIALLNSPRDVLPAVIASGVKWGLPFCGNFLLSAAVRADEAPAAKRPAIREAGMAEVEMILAAARANKPGVIVIDTGDHMLGFGGRKFDYVEWLNAHSDFANVLRHYREADPIGPFRIFVRI
jgi:hypothetical protein